MKLFINYSMSLNDLHCIKGREEKETKTLSFSFSKSINFNYNANKHYASCCFIVAPQSIKRGHEYLLMFSNFRTEVCYS